MFLRPLVSSKAQTEPVMHTQTDTLDGLLRAPPGGQLRVEVDALAL